MSPRLAIAALGLLVACGGSSKPSPSPPTNEPVVEPSPSPSPPPPPPQAPPTDGRPAVITDEIVAIAEELVTVMEAGGRAMTAAGTDCDKGAAAVRGMLGNMKPLVQRAKKFEAEMDDPAAEQWFQARYADRITQSMGGMMTLASACQGHADFGAAIQEMGQIDM